MIEETASKALENPRVREMLARFRSEGPQVLAEYKDDPSTKNNSFSSLSKHFTTTARCSAGNGNVRTAPASAYCGSSKGESRT
jgi:hypothetical protein